MNKLLIYSVVCAVSFFALCICTGYSQVKKLGEDGHLSNEEALKGITSTNWEVRLNAAIAMDRNREEHIKKLVNIVGDTNYSEQIRVGSVVVLGEYRASEAIPLLVEHLGWDDTVRGVVWNGRVSKEEFEMKLLAVSTSLQKIGMPAIQPLLNKVAETDDQNITKKCISICRSIEGSEVTRFRLRGLFEKETDPKRKTHFQAALQQLDDQKSNK